MKWVWLTHAYTNDTIAVNLDLVQVLIKNKEGRGTFIVFDDMNEGDLLVLETPEEILAGA